MPAERVHLSVEEARALGEGALRGVGYDAEEARIIADHVIDAALCGYEYSGLAKILNIPEHRRFAQPRRPMRILHETEVSALYDGGNNVGMLAMYHAAEATIAKAAAHGIAVVGVTDSWMSGRSAYFVEMIARAGLVERTQDPNNRRRLALRLTHAGRDKLSARIAGSPGLRAKLERMAHSELRALERAIEILERGL